MLEMKITVAAPDLAAAINNLTAALDGKNPHTVCNQYGTDNKHIDNVGTINMSMGGKAQPATTAAPVNPTPAPVDTPTQVPGAPLSVTPAPTATPTAPTAPVVAPAPAVTPEANVAPTVPTGAPTYTLEMIATAGTALIDAGKMDALLNLLGKYGVEALTALDPAQYGSFANDLRALGAQI